MDQMKPKEIRNMQGYYSQVDVARRLGIAECEICRMISSGVLPKPAHPWGSSKRKYYIDLDIRKIRTLLNLDGHKK